jgi:hypothetical protein
MFGVITRHEYSVLFLREYGDVRSSVNSTEMLYLVNCVYIWDYRPTELIINQVNAIYSTAHLYFQHL